MKLEFSQQMFAKKLKYQISPKSTQWEPSYSMRTDGQKDTTKLIVAFRNFANAPKKGQRTYVKPLEAHKIKHDLVKFYSFQIFSARRTLKKINEK